jgi:RNA polymerase sigma-70 factor (ECF subfamily)
LYLQFVLNLNLFFARGCYQRPLSPPDFSAHGTTAMLDSDFPASPWNEIDALYQSRRDKLYRLARSIAKDHHDAEDATQEAFVRLYEQAQRSKVISPIAWVNTVVRNLILERLRVTNREETIDSEDSRDLEMLVHQGPSPEEMALDQSVRESIRVALQSLSPIEQRCVALMAMGWNFRQIAGVTGLKYQAAITTTDVAVRKMRKLMSKQSPTPKHAQ